MLIGVMIAVTVVGVVSAGLMSILDNLMQTQRLVQGRQAALALQMYTLGALSEPEICRASFRNYDVYTGANAPTRVTNGTINFVQNGGVYEQNSVRLVGMAFSTTAGENAFRPYMAAPSVNQYKGSLPLILNLRGLGNSSINMVRTIQISAVLKGYTGGTPANEIDTCVAVGNDQNDVWKYSPNRVDIFYGPIPDLVKVGIGTPTPIRDLHVAGDVLAEAFYYASDKRLKENIRPIEGLEAISKIRGYRFNYKENKKPGVGVMAQDVEKVFPEAVFTDPKTDMKLVNYNELIAPLIESVHELSVENKKLRSRLDKLETPKAR